MENELKSELDLLIKSAGEAIKKDASDAIAKANEAFAKAQEILLSEKATKEQMDLMQKQLDSLAIDLKKMPSKSEVKAKNWITQLEEQFKAKDAEIKSIIANNGRQTGPLEFDLKEAVTIGDFNTIEAVGSSSQYSLTENTGIISPIRKRVMTYLQNVSTGTISKPYAMWIEELDEQGTPIFIGEGDTKTQLSVRYEERQAIAKKIAVYGKVTTEFLEDLPQLVSYVQTNLMKRADIVTENQLFAGDGTGDNLKGLTEYATAFTGGSTLPGAVDSATAWDVINAIIAQVKEANGIVNAIFVSNGVIHEMLSTKATDAHYILPQGVLVDAQGNVTAWGVRLIGTNASLGGNDFVGGDLTAANVRFRQGMRLQIGLDGNDFINNRKTILMEQRLVQFVSANDTAVIVKGTMAAAKAILETT